MAFNTILRLIQNFLDQITGLRKKIIQIIGKYKGSIKDPLICLGGVAFILLGLVSSGVFGLNKNIPQSLSFLQKEIMSANLLSCLESPKNFNGQGGEIPEEDGIDLSTVQDSALLGTSMPISPWLWFEGRKEIVEYEVKEGDSISTIAVAFGVSSETILWANNLTSSSLLKTGQKLVILPISGVLYRVQAGDSLSEIAKKYKGDSARIVAFNELSDENDISIGDILVIPDGTMPAAPKVIVPQIPLASNYFIFPVQGRISQGLHFYNAIDIASSCGTPVYAAAQGQVIKISITNSTSTWANRGAGSYLKILHPNGTTTYYGHLMASFVNLGDQVSQGQIIALMGGKPGTVGAGRSTGCHVHFEVGGARNPFVR